MKIEISDYGPAEKGLHVMAIVKEFRKNETTKDYSIFFEDYELVIMPMKDFSIENIKHSFTWDEKDQTINSSQWNFKVILKYRGNILREGEISFTEEYEYGNEDEPKKGKAGEKYLRVDIYCNVNLEYEVYLHPEYGETLLDMYEKIFHLNKYKNLSFIKN